jgi:hypothetical protein
MGAIIFVNSIKGIGNPALWKITEEVRDESGGA